MMTKPKLKYLPRDHDPTDTWVPYPAQSEPVQAHTNCVINSLFDLHIILWDIDNYFFAGEEKPPYPDIERMVDSFQIRLEQWSQQLPDCVSLGRVQNPAITHMQYVRIIIFFNVRLTRYYSMRYYAAIQLIHGFIRRDSDVDDFSRESKNRAEHLRLSAAHNIRSLANLHRTKWPIDYTPLTCMQWVAVALFTLLEDLKNSESSAAFIDLCIILRAMARRWQLAKGMLRLVQLTATGLNVALPQGTEILFRDFEAELWKTSDPA